MRIFVPVQSPGDEQRRPRARTGAQAPMHGMPIRKVSEAGSVVFFVRSMRPGFADIENDRVFDSKGRCCSATRRSPRGRCCPRSRQCRDGWNRASTRWASKPVIDASGTGQHRSARAARSSHRGGTGDLPGRQGRGGAPRHDGCLPGESWQKTGA